jgi:RimJ/RimL family protein N-acetyltransferase
LDFTGVLVTYISEKGSSMVFEDLRKQFFPIELPAGVIGRVVDLQTLFEVGDITAIFDPSALGHFAPPASRHERIKQLESIHVPSGSEEIAFYNSDGKAVGWFWGYMEYADTFTIDTFGLIPEYRGHGIYRAFIRTLLTYLTDVGYERVTVITHPNNRAMLITNLKAGFSFVGMEIRESGGAMVKLAYHLHDDRRVDFRKAFRLPPDEMPNTQ